MLSCKFVLASYPGLPRLLQAIKAWGGLGTRLNLFTMKFEHACFHAFAPFIAHCMEKDLYIGKNYTTRS